MHKKPSLLALVLCVTCVAAPILVSPSRLFMLAHFTFSVVMIVISSAIDLPFPILSEVVKSWTDNTRYYGSPIIASRLVFTIGSKILLLSRKLLFKVWL